MKHIFFFIVILNCYFCCFADNNNKNNDYNQDIKDIIQNNSNSSFNDICDYSANHTGEINTGEHIITLNDNANIRLRNSNINLRGEKMYINLSKSIVEANKNESDQYNLLEKRVRLDLPNNKTLFSDKLKYSYDSLIGIAENVLFVTNNIIIRARKLKKHFNDRVDIEEALFTTCKHRHPKWGFFIKKGTYYKDLIIADNVRFMFGDRIFPIPFPFIYKIPVTKQSGFVYPTSILYSSDYGFTIDPGFYWYINDCADILVRLKFYTSGQTKIDFKHNHYVKEEHKSRLDINLFSQSIISYFYILPNKNPTYDTNLDITYSYTHIPSIQKKIYTFKTDIKFKYREDKKKAKDQQTQVNVYHNFDNILFFKRINISHTYDKNFKTGEEGFNFVDLSMPFKQIDSKYLFISSEIIYKISSSNRECDYILKEENDELYKNTKINIGGKYNIGYPKNLYEEDYEEDEDDGDYNNKEKQFGKLMNKNKFSSKNWKDYFTGQYWLNIWENLQAGLYIPINISTNSIKIKDFLEINSFAKYNMKIYTSILSKLEESQDKYSPKFIYQDGNCYPYFLHMFYLGVNGKIKNTITIFKNTIRNILNLSLTYNPSSDDMQENGIFAKILKRIPFLRLEKAYEKNNNNEKIVDLFSHTIFGNMTKYSQFILSWDLNCNIIHFISFNLSSGYDFLANYKDTFPLKNITLKLKLFGYDLYTITLNPYKYKKIEDAVNINNIVNDSNSNINTSSILNSDNIPINANNINIDTVNSFNNNTIPLSNVNKEVPKFQKTKDIGFSSLSQKLSFPFIISNVKICNKYSLSVYNCLEIIYKYNPVYDKHNTQGVIISDISGQISNSTFCRFRMQIDIIENKYPKIKNVIFVISSNVCDCWYLVFSIELLNASKNRFNCFRIQFKANDKHINMLDQDYYGQLFDGNW